MSQELQFRLPDVGEGLTEGEVLRWLVAEGDEITVNQPLVEVETAKAAVELPSPYAGVVAKLLVGEGEVLPVGTALLAIRVDEGTGPTPAVTESAQGDDATEPKAEGTGPLLVGYGVTEGATRRRRRLAAPSPHGTLRPEAGPPGEPVKPVRHGGLEIGRAAEARFADHARTETPVRAKPPVRRLAKQLGVDLGTVRPTGRDGTVSRNDVEAAAALLSPNGHSHASAVATRLDDRREPVRGVTRSMAAAMTTSASTIPHVAEWVEVDVTRSARLVERMRTLPQFSELKVTPLLLVIKACLAALPLEPRINAVFDDENQEIVYRGSVDLGIAVATDRGLVVPHIKRADALTLAELAASLTDVVGRARSGAASPSELVGGTFTITNVGVFGVDGGTPMITPGQSAILAVGTWRERPWVDQGQMCVRTTCTLSLSFDHRFIDGAAGSRFLRAVADGLEEPALPYLK